MVPRLLKKAEKGFRLYVPLLVTRSTPIPTYACADHDVALYICELRYGMTPSLRAVMAHAIEKSDGGGKGKGKEASPFDEAPWLPRRLQREDAEGRQRKKTKFNARMKSQRRQRGRGGESSAAAAKRLHDNPQLLPAGAIQSGVTVSVWRPEATSPPSPSPSVHDDGSQAAAAAEPPNLPASLAGWQGPMRGPLQTPREQVKLVKPGPLSGVPAECVVSFAERTQDDAVSISSDFTPRLLDEVQGEECRCMACLCTVVVH